MCSTGRVVSRVNHWSTCFVEQLVDAPDGIGIFEVPTKLVTIAVA